MKKKSLQRLKLNKETISKLDRKQMNVIRGASHAYHGCVTWDCEEEDDDDAS